jgi:hypothetical protein
MVPAGCSSGSVTTTKATSAPAATFALTTTSATVTSATNAPTTSTTEAPSGWQELKPQGDVPRARSGATMAYDPASKKMLLFGGAGMLWGGKGGKDSILLDDTWAYDPALNTWTEVPTGALRPPARSDYAMVYDQRSGKIIMFGGSGGERLIGRHMGL